jgi:hypothetical protein
MLKQDRSAMEMGNEDSSMDGCTHLRPLCELNCIEATCHCNKPNESYPNLGVGGNKLQSFEA